MALERRAVRVLGLLVGFIAAIVVVHSIRQSRRRSGQGYAAEDKRHLLSVQRIHVKSRRALSPPRVGLSKTLSGKAPMKDQRHAAFFSILHADIRLLIYELVLGLEILHIIGVPYERRKEGKRRKRLQLGSVTCQGRCSRTCFNAKRGDFISCWGCDAFRLEQRASKHRAKRGKIELLQSCRRIYAEAVDVLYKENTFSFHCMDNFLPFSTTILPWRLHVVRKLHLSRVFSSTISRYNTRHWFHDSTWFSILDLVGKMQGLQELEIDISEVHSNDQNYLDRAPVIVSAEEESILLEALREVTQPRKFIVRVPWESPTEESRVTDMEAVPFQLEHRP